MDELAERDLGRTGKMVTRVGLGGEGVLRTQGQDMDAQSVITEAYIQGISYWDSARAYAGSEGYYGSFWRAHDKERPRIFQTSKSARRDRKGALADLKISLSLMGLPHLDLWQIHDVRTLGDVREIEAPGGALEAFVEARESGVVSSIGVTGHHDPAILLHAVESWPVDTVLLPVNPVEKILGGFLDLVIPAARKRGLGVIGMKVLGAGHFLDPRSGFTPEQLIRFALGEDIDVAIVGCATPEEVRTLAEAGRSPPLSVSERNRMLEAYRHDAKRRAFYRGT
ncbi:MAG: aldo/keto reductase [Methanomicrobiales archaeon]|nr:aldo/keto reductase [Methanomicrobiales archaeon]